MSKTIDDDKENAIKAAHEELALSLFAAYVDVDAAEALAKKEGRPFDRERALRHIEKVMGEDEAQAVRYHWSPEAEAKLLAKAQKGIEQGLRLAAMDRLLARFKNSLTRSAQQLAELLNPANYQPSTMLAFRSENRAPGEDKAELVEPSVDYENGQLFISLDFSPAVGAIPSASNDIQIFVNGEPIEAFECSMTARAVNLVIAADATREEYYRHLSCTVHYNADDLSQIAISLE